VHFDFCILRTGFVSPNNAFVATKWNVSLHKIRF
jgi:hypothetical protein